MGVEHLGKSSSVTSFTHDAPCIKHYAAASTIAISNTMMGAIERLRTPATNLRCTMPESRTPAVLFVQVMKNELLSFLRVLRNQGILEPDSHLVIPKYHFCKIC